MKKLGIRFVLVLCVLSVCGFCLAEEGEPGEAKCVLKIVSDPAVMPINYDILYELIESSPVGGKAIKAVFGDEEVQAEFFIDAFTEGRASMMGGMGMGGGYGGGMIGEGMGGGMMMGGGFGGAMASSAPPKKDNDKDEDKDEDVPPKGEREMKMVMPKSERLMRISEPGMVGYMGGGMMGGMGRSSGMVLPTPVKERAAGNEQTLLVLLQVSVEDREQLFAETLMEVVIENLKAALEKAYTDYSSRINGQLETAERQVAEAEEQFRQVQNQLRELSGGKDLRHEMIGEQIQHLNEKLSGEKMQLELDTILVKDLAERIAEAKAEAEERLVEDSLTREIEEMIKQQMHQLENTEKLFEAGRADAMQLEEMREKIVRAKLELANRRESVRGVSGSELVNRLREDMADRSTMVTLAKARLEQLQKNLYEKQNLLTMADDFELINIRTDVARQNLRESMEYANDLRRRIRMVQPPMVSVIGAE